MPKGRRPSDRGMGRGGMSSGRYPMATNNLQLHDLDLELALLKRKRELISQQQQQLTNQTNDRFNRPSFNFEPPSSHNQPRYNEPQSFNQPRNFSNLYDDSRGSRHDNFNMQPGSKRHAIDPWEDSSSPKRFSGPQRGKPKRFGSGPSGGFLPKPNARPYGQNIGQRPANTSGPRRPPPTKPQPLMGSSQSQFAQKPAQRGRRDFNPSRVTKPKPNGTPKLNSYPVTERKNLVSQSSNLVKSVDKVTILQGVPTPQQLGRLELALGTILKDLKQEYGTTEQHLASFNSHHKQRAMKQALRERIRNVMKGKPISTAADILATYRKKYSKETDIELLNIAMETVPPNVKLAIFPIETDNPEKYFRANFNRLLCVALDKMFMKVQDVYGDAYACNDNEKRQTVQQIIDNLVIEMDKAGETIHVVKDPKETVEQKDSATGENSEEGAKDSATDKTDDEKEPAACENIEGSEDQVADGTTEGSEDPVADGNDSKIDDKNEGEENQLNGKDIDKTKTEAASTSLEVDLDDSKIEETDINLSQTDSPDKAFKAKFYNRLLDVLLRRRLPYILPKFKNHIIKILETDAEYKTTKAYLIEEANKKAAKYVPKEGRKPHGEAGGKTTEPQARTERPPIPYFVKIMGRPNLPKRKAMQTFLDGYNPRSIKKHRGINNLLFVGLGTKEDYDGLVAANKTVIGNSTLDIRVSEKLKQNEKPEPSDDDVILVEPKDNTIVVVEQDSKVNIDAELDDQITDLLSTIRKEEETPETVEDPVVQEEVVQEENSQNGAKAEEVVEIADEEENEEKAVEEPVAEENKEITNDEDVEAVKTDNTSVGTPTRASARIANTPTGIRTRRASKLAQN